jgi:glycosyltransferase involved in cell wall biosynthesis
MKILVVSNLYPPNAVGGYERMCAEVADALVRDGADVTVLTSDYGRKVGSSEQPVVLRTLRLLADRDDIYAPFNATADERAAITLANDAAFDQAVKDVQPDLVFVWNLYFLGSDLMDRIQACGAPAVYFLTDNWLIAARRPERINAFFEKHVHGSEPFVADADPPRDVHVRAKAVFGSNFMRDLYRDTGFTFDDEVVIHNGVRLTPRLTPRDGARGQLRAQGRFKLLFAGRVVDIKGVQDAVRATARARSLAPPDLDIDLTIVGDTQDVAFSTALTEEILRLGLREHVHFEPPVPESALPALFQTYDAYLFPSLYEPFSLTLIHALNAGVPTVASAVGGNAEIVLHGRTGMLFAKGDTEDFAEQILRLVQEPSLRQTLSHRGQVLAARFTFERMMERLNQTLASAAGF